jgi:hypothetical protein
VIDDPSRGEDGPAEEPRLPEWCDLSCPHAGFPPAGAVDGSDSCRTFLALWCGRLERLVAKNARCAARRGNKPQMNTDRR